MTKTVYMIRADFQDDAKSKGWTGDHWIVPIEHLKLIWAERVKNASADSFRKIDYQVLLDAVGDKKYSTSKNFIAGGQGLEWYDHERDVVELSQKFPHHLFLLTGEGQGHAGDLWRKYFRNGKIQRCYVHLIYDEFNENRMEDFVT